MGLEDLRRQAACRPWLDAELAVVHPSSILRGPAEERRRALDALVADLRVAASAL